MEVVEDPDEVREDEQTVVAGVADESSPEACTTLDRYERASCVEEGVDAGPLVENETQMGDLHQVGRDGR